uniref:Uncharacterized protein n=1 Tax=Heterorhabditis bacteriophora TaxID=37862 RepID=A0A1I7WU40_HETBA
MLHIYIFKCTFLAFHRNMVFRTNRKCTKDISINGIKMKKGFIFSVPIRAIHYCEDYYENPKIYDPHR